jgi:hypothetical protein
MIKEAVMGALPPRVREQIDAWMEAMSVFAEIRDPKVLASLGPAGVRGLLLHRGKQGQARPQMRAHHSAHFDWTYPSDQPEMADLYRRAKAGQWDGEKDSALAYERRSAEYRQPAPARGFFDLSVLEEHGVHLDAKEQMRLTHSLAAWMLSQFLHGEQGALFAAAQVTEAVQFFDGKLYGATQVVDEGRHVEVFNRYLDDKLERSTRSTTTSS